MSGNNPYFSNPFAETTEDPFKDPAVGAARNSGRTHTLRTSEDDLHLESVQLGHPEPLDQPIRTNREAELAQREAQLAARERELQQQAEELRLHGGRKPNFPPFYPIYYMDISVEVPEANRQLVRRLFQSWLAFLATLLINFITSILIFASNAPSLTSTTANLGGALTYLILLPIPSFFLWYRPVYNAFMKERAFFYFIYFIFNSFHIFLLAYMAVGIPGTGGCGLINTLWVLGDGQILAAVFGFVTFGLLVALTLGNSILFIKVHRHCQSVGHSFSDAKSEAMSRAAGSNVARNAAGSYARQQFS